MTRISEVSGLESGEYVVQELFGFRQRGVDEHGRSQGVFYATGCRPSFADRLAESGIEMPVSLFEKRELPCIEADTRSQEEV